MKQLVGRKKGFDSDSSSDNCLLAYIFIMKFVVISFIEVKVVMIIMWITHS